MTPQVAKWCSQINETKQSALKRIEEVKAKGRVFIEDVNDVAQDVRTELKLAIAQRKNARPTVNKSSTEGDDRWFAQVNGSLVPDSFDRGEIELPW